MEMEVERDSIRDQKPAPVRRLGDVAEVAAKYGCDERTVYRLADAGLIPWGCKLGRLRRWDMASVYEHIAAGCPKVRQVKPR